MSLIVAFVIAIAVGDVVAVGVGALVEYFSKPVSLIVFLVLFMSVIPIAWKIAVRVTEPKDASTQQSS
jgi:membrane protein implicated in regulation of membrane protease activity